MNIDIQSADEYFSSRLGSEVWFELDETQKNASLTTAKEKIQKLPFIGTKVSITQTEVFPRYYKGYKISMPDDIVKGIFEEALYLAANKDSELMNIPEGIQSVSLGSANITFSNAVKFDTVNKNSMKFLEGWLQRGFDIEAEKFREVY